MSAGPHDPDQRGRHEESAPHGHHERQPHGLGPRLPPLGAVDPDLGPAVNPNDGPVTIVPGADGRAVFPEPHPRRQSRKSGLTKPIRPA
jgi:hypothetical protein